MLEEFGQVEVRCEFCSRAYRFDAVDATALFAPPPRRFDPDTTVFTDYPPRFRLYDVRLTLDFRGHERVYLYQELAWLPMPE